MFATLQQVYQKAQSARAAAVAAGRPQFLLTAESGPLVGSSNVYKVRTSPLGYIEPPKDEQVSGATLQCYHDAAEVACLLGH
jgi:hypothetical protein